MTPIPSTRVCRTRGTLALLFVSLLAVTGCSRPPPGNDLQPGSYRAVVRADEAHEVPFGLDIAREEQGFVLYLLNGEERIRVTDVQAQAGRVTAQMPGYESTLIARVSGDELEGTITFAVADDRRREWPFRAKLGETWRFFPERRSDNADMAGRWELTFTDAAGRPSRAVADLRQRYDQVDGTVVRPTGDERYLAGEVHDEELRLSRFDGGALVVYRGELDAQGRWVGETWSDRDGARRFVAVRNPDAVVDAAGGAVVTRLRGDPAEPLRFEFPDLDGRPVSFSDPRLSGRPAIVAVLGSWNPASHDAATLLAELERRYGGRGLAVVGLMFERHAERARAVAAIHRFRAAHHLGFPTLLAGTVDGAAAALPRLDGGVRVYPTLLFLDRDGRVRKVHTGLHGPAAALQHEQMLREFEQTIEGLLAGDAAVDAAASAPDATGAHP